MLTPAGSPVRVLYAGLVVALALVGLILAVSGCESPAAAETTEATASQSSTTQTEREEATSSPTEAAPTTVGEGLFDSSIVHEIVVSFDQAEYEEMIETYSTSGTKEWIEANVTIDGYTYQQVGMRLKGNSSIRGLRDGRSGGGPSANSSADRPEGLPWLIRLDKYIDGQNHQGIVDLVVRSNTWETSLNEAVSLELLEMAGLASQQAIAARFSVNGSEVTLRLVTENPDDLWMQQNLGSGGALFKAESTGDYSYRGSDPESYDEVFDQEAGKDNTDLTPLIDFLDFINNAEDATFNAELGDHLDIDSFATYLAMEELIANFDDIDGPGNNSYLYYDLATDKFTVVPWDHNLAFGGFRGGQDARGVGPADPAGEGPARPGGARNKSNILVERFHANPEFEALCQQKLVEMRSRLYESGGAADVLDRWVNLLETQAADLVDRSTVQQEAARVSQYFSTP